jgi:Protein of unknown function (DUF4019)
MRRNFIASATVAALLLSAPALARAAGDSVPQAKQAAAAWLKLVDQGNYAQSWSDASSFFKAHVDQPTWETQVSAVREPLGGVVSRKVKGARYMTSLPGAPDGKYVVIQYETSFEHKKSAIETVTPMLDGDGDWRVSGYYIR